MAIELKDIFIRPLNNNLIKKSLLSYKEHLPRIVYYHLVSDTKDIPYYYKKNVFTERSLHEQLSWFKNNRYTFITLDEAVWLAENNEKAGKTIAFTTDDGFTENYSVIAPIFYKHNIKSTLFLISNCLDNNDLTWNSKINLIKSKISPKEQTDICKELSKKYNLTKDINDLTLLSNYFPIIHKDDIANYAWKLAGIEPLKEYLKETQPYMTNAQVKELIALGYTIGSHSASHPEFPKLSIEEAKEEMIYSKKVLENTFDTEVNYFAYPYGKRIANKKAETEILETGVYKRLFGTKSNLTNNKDNKVWERDKMEQDIETGKFWFTAIPVLRKTVLHPLGLYL